MGDQRGCGGQPGSRPPGLRCCVLPWAGVLSLIRGQGPGSVQGVSDDPVPQALSPMSPRNRASPRAETWSASPLGPSRAVRGCPAPRTTLCAGLPRDVKPPRVKGSYPHSQMRTRGSGVGD